MGSTIQDKIKSLPPEQRKEVEELGAKLIAEEYARRQANESGQSSAADESRETAKVDSFK